MSFLKIGWPLVFSLLLTGDDGHSILATWLNASGEAKILIYAKDDRFSGKIAWLKNPLDESGKPKVDHKNPDDNLKTRALMGLVLLKDFRYVGNGKWEEGEIYDPKSGKTYSCHLTLVKEDELEVRGYVGISLIGRSEIWKKVK